MIWRTVLHFTWLWIVLSVASGLSDVQKEEIVQLHNQLRGSVNPPAANMKRMLWDETLSTVAARYAAQCIWAHNPYIQNLLGEGMFLTLGPLVVSQPLNLWYGENNNYNFNSNECAEGKICGHYTQMVWANTSYVGCASQYCPKVSDADFNTENSTLLICNYYPAGNLKGETPYKAGPSCSSCPDATLSCANNYCDEGSSITVANLIANMSAASQSNYNHLLNAAYMNSGNSAGSTTPSAATLLFAALTAFYIRMT